MSLPLLCQRVIQPRPAHSHKGTFGHVLLIGGLSPYGGAIIMAALAAVNSGAGLVTVATEATTIPALHAHLPEAMAFPVEDRALLISRLTDSNLVLIGPGLGENHRADQLLDLVLDHLSGNQILLLDGSALNLLAKKGTRTFSVKQVILTPHQKEWERLSGVPVEEQNLENIFQTLHNFQDGTILVAKSHNTHLLQAGIQKTLTITVGGPHQATGGMGDTLAGMIAGFAVQFPHASLYERVTVATYLHSSIADQLAKDYYVVKPTDISKHIQNTMQGFIR